MAMLSGAIGNDRACAQLRDFLQSRLTQGTSGGGDAALRAGITSAMLVGIITSRQIIGVPVLAGAERTAG